MPELPEVETVRRGLEPLLVGHTLTGAEVREARLRWPVPAGLSTRLQDRRVVALRRRGKYLLVDLDQGGLIVHLGMSGSLRLSPPGEVPARHDHVDLIFDDGRRLRLRDPRRFGAVLWSDAPETHPLLAGLGLEPLAPEFDGPGLHRLCRGRRLPIKALLMDAHRLVGVGNIYANESLFHAGIHPLAAADRLSARRAARLANAIRVTLEAAIAAGGSSLRDFVDGHGRPGYFQQLYFVYGRAGESCRHCGQAIVSLRLGGRATYLCPRCQPR